MILSFKDNFYRRSEFYLCLLVVAAGSATFCSAAVTDSWYVGCYQLPSEENLRNSTENVTVLGVAGNPISCGRQCLDLRYNYTAIYSNGCFCSNNLPVETLKLLQTSCNITCAFNTSGLVASENDDVPLVQYLPCGGSADAVSVYLSAGPYLYKLSSFIAISTIHVDQAFVLSVILSFAGHPGLPLGFEFPMTVLPPAVYIESACPVNSPLIAKTKSERINIICIASAEGNWTANITVANVFSEIESSVSYVVLVPIISQLEVTSLPDEELLPSCSPELDPDNATSQRVFEGILTKFEASVPISSNDIVFDWLFINSFGVIVFNVSQNGSASQDGQSCTVSIQNYRFNSAGTYSVYVNASNGKSSASDEMQLVVVSPGIENMTLAMQTPVGVRGEKVNILVSMVASLLQKTVAVIDFGDGTAVRQIGFRCRDDGCRVNRDGRVDRSRPEDTGTLVTITSATTMTVASSLQTTAANDPDWDHLEIMETYSYGHDCQLLFEVGHSYAEEGSFQPTVTAGDGFSNVSVSLDGFLTIANKLKSVVILGHGSTEAVGHNVSFTAATESLSLFVSYFWQVFREDSTIVLERQTNGSVLSYVFREPGQYEILVNASNPVDSVSVASNIVIEAPIQNLQISCFPSKYVAVYQPVNCSATVDSGTNVDFKWSFCNVSGSWTRSRNVGLLSNAIHRFFSLGSYTVSVNASNSIGWLSGYLPDTVVVMEPVSNLWSLLPPPALLGGAITFEVRAEAGMSDFVLEFDFGDSSERVSMNASTGVNVSVSHEYVRVGSYRAKVIAWNEVSRIKKRFDVDILEDIRNVTLAVVGPSPVNGRRTVFAARVDGRLSGRSDLVYNWSINGDVFSVTQSPVTQLKFNDSSAIHNVSIVVYNLVVLRSAWLVVNMTNVSHDTSIRFDHDVFTAVGLSTTFMLINMQQGKVEIHYGDGSNEEIETLAADLRFEHTYAEPGLYEVLARCYVLANDSQTDDDDDEDDDDGVGVMVVRTAISVQRRLTNLTLSGPDVLPTNRLSEPSEWSADVSNATNVVYVWMLDNVVTAVTTKNKIYRVTSVGHQSISVVASNGLGQLTANKSISLQNPIISVVMEINDVALGAVSCIYLVVRGDRDFQVACSFGDGTVHSNATVESFATRSNPDEDESSADEIPLYAMTIRHRYLSVGYFPVLVNVTNRVSWLTANETARVFEPIGDVVVTTDSAVFVSSGSVVAVTAVAMVNYNLTFSWKSQRSVCSSSSLFNGSFWQSKANCSLPSVAGTQLVVVNVSSYLADNWRTVNVSFTCVDPVRDLVLVSSSPTAAAVLKANMTHVGNYYTDPVRFEASLSQGSNVSCLFDFGENSSSSTQNVSGERLDSSIQMPLSTRCRATHVFRKAGVYRVNVTTVNPISILSSSMLFYVQVPPSGLRLARDPEPYRTRVGQDVIFSANLSAGTDVSYSWWLGSGQVYFQADRTITHRYASLGCYSVSVTAANKVGSVSASASVYVQDLIQSVELVANVPVSPTGIVIQNGATVSFTATVHPNVRCLADGYEWKPLRDHQDLKDIPYTTIAPNFVYTYRKLGTFTVTVTARNTLNQQTSEPLIVSVLDELQEITIQIAGETITNNQIEFDAYHFKGTNVNYMWNFGDNTTANATVSKVKHTYTTVGEFVVRVVARNAISQQTANQKIFIVTKFCKPPVIELLGPPNAVYWRSEDVKIEATIFINCSITNATTYSWVVLDVLTGATYNVHPFALHDPLLFLPKLSLPYGNYSVRLRVSMDNTIVYGDEKDPYEFSVVPSPLQAILDRGLMRNVSYSQNITFDGSKSWDPDFPEENDFTYSWSCVQLNNPDRTCFADSQVSEDVASYSRGVLILPGSKFRHNSTKDFVFELTISRPGRSNSSAQQLLKFQEQPAIDVFISCDDCADNRVNANSRLVLQAVHSGYAEKNMFYTWTLFDRKPRNSRTPRGSSVPKSCISWDGPAWNLFVNGSASNRSYHDAQEQRSYEDDDDDDDESGQPSSTPLAASGVELNSPEGKMTTTLSMAAATRLKDPDSSDAADLAPSPVSASSSVRTTTQPSAPGVAPWIMADEGNSGGRGRRPGWQPLLPSTPTPPAVLPSPSPVQPLLSDFGKSVGERAAKGALPPWHFNVGEQPSEGRGGSHRGSAPSSQQPPQERMDNQVNPAIDLTKTNKDANKYEIFRTERNERQLLPDETTTGINQRILVINPNVLSQGLQYFVQVNIQSKVTNETGTSTIAFHVNKSPYRGQCSLNYDAINGGTEMLTEFIVFCRGWKDEDLPISYEANYRLSAMAQPQPIYRGLNKQITFQLPAGNPDNYTVLVEVAVVDGLGARTTVCLSPLVIQPSAADEEILYALVEDNSTLASHIERGHNQKARLLALMAALRLNILSKEQNETQLDLRKVIRTELISQIRSLPLRDMLEVHQSLSVLAEVMKVTDEIVIEGARSGTFLLDRICRLMMQLVVETNAEDFPLVDLAIESASNLISALLVDSPMTSIRGFEISARNGLVMKSLEYVETLLTVKARQLFLDQEAIKQSTPTLSTFTGHFGLNRTQPIVFLDQMSVMLPPLQLLYRRNPDDPANQCFESNVVLYKENPFIYQQRSTVTIKTDIVSATMYSCNGSALNVDNLPRDHSVSIWLANRLHQDSGVLHVLTREFMNIHVFNLTSSDLQKDYLHIDVEFVPFHQLVRAFPVTVLLQVDTDPSPSSYLFKWELPAPSGSRSLVVDLAALKIEGDRSFHLGFVDHNYNSLRPRPAQAKNMSYQLSLWWGQCLFWNMDISDWSGAGCSIANSSSFRDIHCQCNHMTTYGANVVVYPNAMHQLNVDFYFSLPLNPVTCSFIGSLLLIYFIFLFIANKLDSHDIRKLMTVSLVDNSPKDRQKYYITLETGFRRGAGTTAKVNVVLHGEYGMSETRELISQTGQPLFERNSRDTFYMTFPESLGSIFKVQLWHDNSGPSPSWYLSRVTVKDACTGDIYYFVCEKWFAVEKEDGKVEREVMAADKGLSFSKILTAKSMQYLMDYHLWFSTLVKPSYSRFSRAQRLTCCLCLLMSYMAVSTAWYQYVGPPYRGEFSLIDISWQAIIVGMIISVIVLPPTLLIMLIFRRSRVFRSQFDEDFADDYSGKECVSSSSSEEEQPSGLSVFEQTMMSWQSLQEWAQKAWAKHYQQSPIGSTQNVKPVTIQNASDQRQPSVDSDREDQPRTKDRPQTEDQPKTEDQTKTETSEVHAQRIDEPERGRLESGFETDRQTSVESTCSGNSGAEQAMRENQVEAWDVDVEEVVDGRRRGQMECQDGAEAGGEGGATAGKQGKAEEKQEQQVKCRIKCHMRSKRGNSSSNTSPSSSFFESSPKETRRPFAQVVDNPSDGCLASSAAPAPLQPPSYGIIRSDASASSRYASSHGTPSNRSSVKSTCSAATSNCSKRKTLKKWRCFVPHYGVYVGWILCALLVMGCAAVTIYYGYRFSTAQSILWLQSVFFSFLQCIFITHPIIVLAVMIYSGIRYRNDMSIFEHYSDGLIKDKDVAQDSFKDLNHEKQKLGHSPVETKTLAEGIAARQRSRYLRFARPPQEQRLIQARHQTMKETNASALFKETVLFVGQFLLLVFIAFGKETETSYQLKASLTKSFVGDGDTPFEQVSNVSEWWQWVGDEFLEIIYDDEGFVDNCNLIGPVSLRQLRIRDQACYIDPPTTTNPRCRSVYSQAPHETDILVKRGTHYNYTDAESSGSCTVDGKFSSYGGDGYAVSLDGNRVDSAWQLKYLEESHWIDAYTSAVIIELTLFHPQSNLFATVSLLLEIPPLGLTFASSRVAVVYLYKYITPMDNLVLACELLFFLATLLKIHREIIQVLRHGINYLKNVWNVLEVSQCLLSLALIICYTYRFLLIDALVEKFRSTYLEEFVDVSNLAYWDQVLRSVTGFVLLLVNLQLVKGLRHHHPFARFTNVYNHTSLDFVVFGCTFVIWLGAYVSLGIGLFGGIMWEMTSLSQAVGYMTGLLECSYKFPQFKGFSPSEMTIWELYTISFLVLAYGTNTGYLLAFLTFHYKVFKDEPVLVFGPKESLAYYWQKAVNLFIRKSDDAYERQKQQEIVLPPEFTMAEIQYQVDEMLFKMNALAGTSNLPEKPAIYFTDSDTTCVGIAEDLSSSTGSSGEGHFEGWLHHMKENLFLNEPHFAQLINSDSQSVVKQEANRQLILQLEMEILRHLQSKRASNNQLSESGVSTNNGAGAGGGGGVGTGALSSPSGCPSTSSSDSSTSAALCAHMSSTTARPWTDEIKTLKEVPCLGAMFATNDDGKNDGPSQVSRYHSQPDSNPRTSAVNELGAIQRSPKDNASRVADSALELQVLNHLRLLADDDDDEDDSFDYPLGILPDDVMETEFGSDTILRLLVPGRNRGRDEGKEKRGRLPSWTSVGSTESATSHEADSREVATEVAPAAHGTSAPAAHPGLCEGTVDEGFGLVEEDVFGFENEGYVIESNSEDSD